MTGGSKPSAIHGRLREYNMDIMQFQTHRAWVVCWVQGQLWHSQQSPSLSVTVSNIPHGLQHSQQSPWWPQTAITWPITKFRSLFCMTIAFMCMKSSASVMHRQLLISTFAFKMWAQDVIQRSLSKPEPPTYVDYI